MYFITNHNLINTEEFKKKIESQITYVLGDWTSDLQYQDFLQNKNIKIIDISKIHLKYKNKIKLDRTYVYFLQTLVKFLNTYHNVDYSLRSWEIIIGPWLRLILSVFFSKLLLIENISISRSTKFITKNFQLEDVVSKDTDEFIEMTYDSDWSSSLDSLILKFYNFDIVKINYPRPDKKLSVGKEKKNYLLNILHKVISYKGRKLFITGLGMNRFLQFLITTFTLNGFLRYPKIEIEKKIDHNLRKAFIFNDKDNLEEYMYNIILGMIPPIYLEEFELMSKKSLEIYPKKAARVITSLDHFSNETFKCWLGIRLNKDTNYVIMQHGGTYGVTKYGSQHEFTENRTANYRFTWGWSNGYKNIIPFFSLKLLLLNFKKSKNSKKIAIICTRRKSQSRYDPWDSPKWNHEYTNTIVDIINGCKREVSKNFLVRLHPQQEKYGVDLEMIIRNKTEAYNFDDRKNIQYLMKESKLCVCTNNATVFLECLKSNKPSILILWDYKLSPVSFNSKNDYKKLIRAGIVYIDTNSTINFLNKNYEKIDEWWQSKKVQEARIAFKDKYASTNLKYLSQLMKK